MKSGILILIFKWMIFILRIIVVALSFFILLPPIAIICLPLPKVKRMAFIRPFWSFFNYFNLEIIFRVKVYREDERDPSARNYSGLFISNHQSLTDIFLIGAYHPVPALMKREILFIPIFGITAYSAGGIAVNRRNPVSRKKALEECKFRLSNGLGIQIYPEGTRSKTDRPKPFEEIYAALIFEAFDLKTPVIPISVSTLESVDSLTKFMKPKSRVGLKTFKAVDPNNFKTKEEFARFCWQKVIDGYDELVKKIEPLQLNPLSH